MRGNWKIGLFAVFGVVAVAGIGFAAYTTSATAYLNASAGSFYLTESGVVQSSSLSATSGSCSVGPAGNPLILTASNLLPGDNCVFNVTVTDPGTIGALGPVGYISGCSGGCTQLTAGASWVSPYGDLAPLAASQDHYTVTVTDIGSGVVAESDSWTLTIVGTPA